MGKITASIRGRSYSLSCAPGGEARMEELAARLDERVGEIVDTVGDLGELRLLVAAGISLLDELDHVRQETGSGDQQDMEQRISRLERQAAATLREAASRIDDIAERVEQAT